MIVGVGIRYQGNARAAGMAESLVRLHRADALRAGIAKQLCFLSEEQYCADDVKLVFDEGNSLDYPSCQLAISITASGELPENKVIAALDKLEAYFRGILPAAHFSLELRVGTVGVAKESEPPEA